MEIAIAISVGIGAIAGGIFAYCSRRHDIELDASIDDKLKELPSIFSGARVSLKIATDFDSRFFEKEIVKNAISNAISNGAKIQILTEHEAPVWYQQQTNIEIKNIQALDRHVMTIDKRHVRLERSHPPLEFGKTGGDIALIFNNFPALGERYSQEFDTLWIQTS